MFKRIVTWFISVCWPRMSEPIPTVTQTDVQQPSNTHHIKESSRSCAVACPCILAALHQVNIVGIFGDKHDMSSRYDEYVCHTCPCSNSDRLNRVENLFHGSRAGSLKPGDISSSARSSICCFAHYQGSESVFPHKNSSMSSNLNEGQVEE